MARHLRNAASVDPDRRQDSPGPHALAEPFLARRAVRHRARADDLADSRRRPAHSRSTSTSSIIVLRISHQRRRHAGARAGRTLGREFLRGRDDRARASSASTSPSTTMPNELPDPIRFRAGRHACHLRSGRGAALSGRSCVSADRVFKQFRTGFLGKASPVHFFWGSFDLAVTRFSGRRAPRHPGGVPHLSDCRRMRGLFARGQQRRLLAGRRRDRLSRVLFLCLSGTARLSPTRGAAGRGASSARRSANSSCPTTPCAPRAQPDQALLEFLQSTYEAAADAAKWDRDALECPLGKPGVVRTI